MESEVAMDGKYSHSYRGNSAVVHRKYTPLLHHSRPQNSHFWSLVLYFWRYLVSSDFGIRKGYFKLQK